jgi:hypothetical protein
MVTDPANDGIEARDDKKCKERYLMSCCIATPPCWGAENRCEVEENGFLKQLLS